MNDALQETSNDWIDYTMYRPANSGYYEVTCCDDPDNVIKWNTVAYSEEDNEFYTISTLNEGGKHINLVRFWRNIKQQCL